MFVKPPASVGHGIGPANVRRIPAARRSGLGRGQVGGGGGGGGGGATFSIFRCQKKRR